MSADDHHSTRLLGPSHRQPGPDALHGLKLRTTAKLKLGTIGDLKTVRLTIGAVLRRDRDTLFYAEVRRTKYRKGRLSPLDCLRECFMASARLRQGEADHSGVGIGNR